MRAADWVVLCATLAAFVAYGVWRGRGSRDLSGFLLAGRGFRWYTVWLSVMATQVHRFSGRWGVWRSVFGGGCGSSRVVGWLINGWRASRQLLYGRGVIVTAAVFQFLEVTGEGVVVAVWRRAMEEHFTQLPGDSIF